MTDAQTMTDAALPAQEPKRSDACSTRRVVLLGAGAAGATALLAACGTDPASTNTSGSDFSDNPAPAGSSEADATGDGDSGGSSGSTLAAVADVPEGGGIITGDYVITQPTAGTFKCFSKVCTHQGCDVNKVEGGKILCPCHGAKYSIETGEPTGGPAKKALKETKVKADGDDIVAA